MDQFTVPQFIEHEAKIVGPLTFKQFIYVGIAGAISFILYFTLGKTNFFLFLLLTMILMGGGFTLAFVKIGGRTLPIFLKNFLFFSLAPKMYLWKKKGGLPPRIIKTEEMPKEIIATPVPKIMGKSRLKNLSTEIDTK